MLFRVDILLVVLRDLRVFFEIRRRFIGVRLRERGAARRLLFRK